MDEPTITDLKLAMNRSIKELVRMHLALKAELTDMQERLDNYNKRGGHRI